MYNLQMPGSLLFRQVITLVLLLISISARTEDKLPVIDKDIAHRMGTIYVLSGERICPLNTVATDFVIRLTGSASWHGYSADEVFFSWMVYYGPWEKVLLGSLPNLSPAGDGSEYPQAQEPTDERYALLEKFYSGQLTRIFPYALSHTDGQSAPLSTRTGGRGESLTWFSPGGQVLPREIPVKVQFFIKQSMDFLTEAIVTGQRDRALEIIAKIKLFQREMAGDLLPGDSMTKAEILYNRLRGSRIPLLVVFIVFALPLLRRVVKRSSSTASSPAQA